MLKTHMAFCLDESGSVRGISKALVDSYNKNVQGIKEAIFKEGQEATISAFAFGGEVAHRTLYSGVQIQTVKPLPSNGIKPYGSTPLFDSLLKAIKELEKYDDGDFDTCFVVSVVTDGEENSSRDLKKAINLMNDKIKTDRWTFTFMVPNKSQINFSRCFNIPMGNIQGWDTTSQKGTEEAFHTNTMAYEKYFSSRTQGVRSTQTFYSDLSNVSIKDVKKSLADISKDVKFYTTNKVMEIRPMAIEVTGDYIKGSVFYQLVKPEKVVQPYKLIAIRNKVNGKVYAGSAARQMLGIDVNHNIRLAPGDHGEWDIFIQSTSVNRKINPGNYIMVWLDAVNYAN